jgi:hypothetical protein
MGADRRPFSSLAIILSGLSIMSAWPAVGSSRADLVYFRKGGEAQLPLKIEGKCVKLVMPDGPIELLRNDFRAIVPGFWPEAEWEDRRRKVRNLAFADRYALAWWAIENGLTREVVAELRALHKVDPSHGPTARMVAVLDRLDRSIVDPDFAPFQRALGGEFAVVRSPHVLLLHQHSEADAQERIETLERVLLGYHLLFAAQGVELSVPRQRLVSAWFANQKDYLAFLHTQAADAFATTRGYFHPTWDAVVAFDARSTDEQRKGREALRSRREELQQLGAQVDRAPARSRLTIKVIGESARTVGRAEAKTFIASVDREITCELLLLELDRRSIDLGTAAHEMIHQLAANTGLVSGHDGFPYWLNEGLAAQFEVIRGGRWAGISRAHDLRLPDWRKVAEPLALERLVRDAGFGHGYSRDLYAQAWALVYYLRTQRPQQFLTFLDLLRSPMASRDSQPISRSDRYFRAFERAFGPDLANLERNWRLFMNTVKTPLEQNAPVDQQPAQSKSANRKPAADSSAASKLMELTEPFISLRSKKHAFAE